MEFAEFKDKVFLSVLSKVLVQDCIMNNKILNNFNKLKENNLMIKNRCDFNSSTEIKLKMFFFFAL